MHKTQRANSVPKIANYKPLRFIRLDRTLDIPLHRQLGDLLQDAVLSGKLQPGTRLPSSRILAEELDISRNTVSRAYTQLIQEGYFESLVGSGTRVTYTLPEDLLHVVNQNEAAVGARETDVTGKKPRLAQHSAHLVELPYDWERAAAAPFDSALPDMDAFPSKIWEKLLVSTWRGLANRDLGYQSALGYLPLRQALAEYLSTTRAVRCNAEQVVITNGAQQALSLSMGLLLNRGDQAWVEDPCYYGVKAALNSAMAEIVPVPVDQDGLDVEYGIQHAPNARMVYISPSYQYPTGATLSLTRRLKLLQWAADNRKWIVEDDYDSEFRYAGYPIESVQGLDRGERVVYVGTFSKVLFPALRVGYMVVPPALVEPFHAARAHMDRGGPILEQAVLAQFISEGHLARHMRQMRTRYAERQKTLIEMSKKFLDGLLEVQDTKAGLHLVGWLPNGVDDKAVSQALRENGILAQPLSDYALEPMQRTGLILGITSVDVLDIPQAVKKVAAVLSTFITSR